MDVALVIALGHASAGESDVLARAVRQHSALRNALPLSVSRPSSGKGEVGSSN